MLSIRCESGTYIETGAVRFSRQPRSGARRVDPSLSSGILAICDAF
jgi:hypothetical protein